MPQGLLPYSSEHPFKRVMSRRSIGFRINFRILTAAAIIICCIIYVLCYFFVSDYIYIDKQYEHIVDEKVIASRQDFQQVTIDKMCSKITPLCYTVVDKRNIATKAEVVERHMLVDGLEDLSDTTVILIPPKGESFVSSDTRIWPVNHTAINTQYVAGLLISPFLLESIVYGPDRDVGKKILEIGMGGGSFDMAMSSWKPKVDITVVELDSVIVELAHKWFDVKDGENRKTVIGDGVEYVKKAASRGEKFDVIVVDACDGDPLSPCPAKPFRTEDTIELFKSVLTDSGSIVVNVLTTTDDKAAHDKIDEVVRMYTSVFPTCLQMAMTSEVNIILSCVKYSVGNMKEQQKLYESRLKHLISSLSLSNILSEVNIR